MLGPLEKSEIDFYEWKGKQLVKQVVEGEEEEQKVLEEKQKLFLNDEKDTLYGNFYLTEQQMS